jgi:hypothetical protein
MIATVLSVLNRGEYTVLNLYHAVSSEIRSLSDYMDTLDYLFALGKISINEEGLVKLHAG